MTTMDLLEPFEPSTEEGNTLIPPGEYIAQVIEAKNRQPQSGDGYALSLTWQILEGEYEGRNIWQWLSYVHSNELTRTIARKTFKDLCDAIGWDDVVKDATILLHKPCRVRVKIQVNKSGSHDDQNKITRIKPLAAAAAPADQPSPPEAATDGATADKPPEASTKPAPRTQGAPRPGPAGTAPWHKQR